MQHNLQWNRFIHYFLSVLFICTQDVYPARPVELLPQEHPKGDSTGVNGSAFLFNQGEVYPVGPGDRTGAYLTGALQNNGG
jgi:hypothetical protein